MDKKIVVFVVVFSGLVFGQFKYGIQAGLLSSSLTGKDAAGYTNASGLSWGVSAEYRLESIADFELGLIFAQKGLHHEIVPGLPGEANFNYLEAPICVKRHVLETSLGTTSVLGGVYFAKLLSSNYVPDDAGQTNIVPLDEMLPSSDYGFLAGIEHAVPYQKGAFRFRFFYSRGLASMDKQYSTIKWSYTLSSAGTKDLFNTSVGFSVGYVF